MSTIIMQRTELVALVDDLLHAVLGASENKLRQRFDDGCRAFANLPLNVADRVWIKGELSRIGGHLDLR